MPTNPTNFTALTALDISALPYTETFKSSVLAGANPDLWFSYTGITGDIILGLWAFTGVAASKRPFMLVYTGPASSPVTYSITVDVNNNVPYVIPVSSGLTLYFRVVDAGVDVAGVPNLSMSAVAAPTSSAELGSIVVNDDTNGYPAAVLSSVNGDNNHVLTYLAPVVAGEGGDVLSTSGDVLLADQTNGQLVQYSDDLSTVMFSTAFTAGTSGQRVLIRANQTSQRWYAGQRNYANPPHILKVLPDGTSSTLATLSNNGLNSLAVNDDESIVYLSGNIALANSNVRQWNVGGAAFGADLVATVANYSVTDMLWMSDQSLLVLYRKTVSPGDIYVKRYSAAGATLNTYTLATGAVIPANTFGYRLAFAIDSPTSFWAWFHRTGGISVFQNIRVSDGTVLSEVTYGEYEIGNYNASETATPIARFGPSISCPFFILRAATPTPAPAEPVEYLIRRERIFPHIGQEQLRQFFSKLQIDLYAGNGISTGQGSDPLLEIDWSDDGGHTWSDIHFVQTGAIGAFRTRAILRRMGSSRDRVYRIACSDPVQWSVVNGYLDATLGTS